MKQSVKIVAPCYKLQEKLSAPIKHMPLERVQQAERIIESQQPSFDKFLSQTFDRWKSDPTLDPDRIYRDAHDLRGLAGTFRRPLLGRAADTLCSYVEGARGAAIPIDTGTMAALKNVVVTCATHEADAPTTAMQLIKSAQEAIQVKLAAGVKASAQSSSDEASA